MKKFIFESKDAKLLDFLADKIPYNTLLKLFRKGEIRVNGKKVYDNIRIRCGDEVTVYGDKRAVKAIYDDQNILVCYKPKGISIENFETQVREVLTKKQNEEQGEEQNGQQNKKPDKKQEIILCHRLDTNTDGLVLFAKSAEVERQIFEAFKSRQITKKYLALVNGNAANLFASFGGGGEADEAECSALQMQNAECRMQNCGKGSNSSNPHFLGGGEADEVECSALQMQNAECRMQNQEASAYIRHTAYLSKDKEKGKVIVKNQPFHTAEKIQTAFKLFKYFPTTDSTLLKIQLITGKTHQIRAHLAHLGHFVIGDGKYGIEKINRQKKCHKQQLTAYFLSFDLPPDSPLSYLNNLTIQLDQPEKYIHGTVP